MTPVAVPTRNVRPVSWTRLSWISWRRARATLAGIAAVLAVIAFYLVARR
jgi:hypothetical protein